MKKLFNNKKIQKISITVMGLIFILLLFTKGIPYGIKIGSETTHEKGMSDAGAYSENILLIYNIILIGCTIILNIFFCIFSERKTINIIILIAFIVCSIFISVISENLYNITIAGRSKEISYSQKINIINIITGNI